MGFRLEAISDLDPTLVLTIIVSVGLVVRGSILAATAGFLRFTISALLVSAVFVMGTAGALKFAVAAVAVDSRDTTMSARMLDAVGRGVATPSLTSVALFASAVLLAFGAHRLRLAADDVQRLTVFLSEGSPTN